MAAPPPPDDNDDEAVEPRAEDLAGEREIGTPRNAPATEPELSPLAVLAGGTVAAVVMVLIFR